MPTLLRLKGYRFYFYSHESGEPPHVHVDKAGNSAKFWTESVSLVQNFGFAQKELREIARIILNYRLEFLRKWDAYFKQSP